MPIHYHNRVNPVRSFGLYVLALLRHMAKISVHIPRKDNDTSNGVKHLSVFWLLYVVVMAFAPSIASAQVGWRCPDEPTGAPLYDTLNACRNSPCPSNCVAIDETLPPPPPDTGGTCQCSDGSASSVPDQLSCVSSVPGVTCTFTSNLTSSPPVGPAPLLSPPSGGTSGSGSCDPTKQLCNPLKADTFAKLVKSLANILVEIAIPFVVIFLIWSGFLFVSARGNEQQLTKAKQTFYWTILGAAVVVGAYALASAVVHFAQSLSA